MLAEMSAGIRNFAEQFHIVHLTASKLTVSRFNS